jgi:opacity protein-like surface antigen
MSSRFVVTVAAAALVSCLSTTPASAQDPPKKQPPPRAASAPPPPRSKSVQIGGFGMIGSMTFTAKDSFDAALGSNTGLIYGGGARIGFPWGGLFAEVGAWRFHDSGERVFVYGGSTFPLGITTDVTMTPIELSAGWRFRVRKHPKLTPYAAGGFTSMRYQETSDFSSSSDDVDENFAGYHLFGGAEYKVSKWLGVAGEAAWTSVPNAIGEAGVSSVFGDDNLGGVSFRFKLTVGR